MAGIALAIGALEAAPTVTRTVEADPATEIKAFRPDVRYGWRISNDGAAEQPQATLIVRTTLSDPASACTSASRCALGWSLDGRPLVPNTPEPVPLNAFQSHELIYEGRALPLGLYQSRAVISQPGLAVPVAIDIRVRRVLPELAANAIVIGPIGTQNLPFLGTQNLPILGRAFPAPAPVPVTIANGSAEPVTLSGAARARLLRDDGTATFGSLAREVELHCPAFASAATIEPGDRLSCSLAIPLSIGPGRYQVSLSFAGTGVTGTSTPVNFSLRYPWIYAWLILLAGGVAGAWVADYQGSKRRRALQVADAQDLSDRAGKMHEGFDAVTQVDARGVLDKIIDDLKSAIALLRTTRTADFHAQIDAVKVRLPAIGAFGPLEKEYRALTGPRPESAYQAALDAVSADTLPADAAEKLKSLKDAIEAAKAAAAGKKTVLATDADADVSNLFSADLPSGSSSWLREWVDRNDKRIAIATILLAATIGVVTLWKGNASWGSIENILVAFFTGFGGTLAGTLTLRELVAGYPLGRVPTSN